MGALTYHPEAKAEMRDAAAWYENEQSGLGDRFLAVVDAAARQLLTSPVQWRKIKGPYRRALVRDFPYGIIYREEHGTVYVIAVMHLKRKPSYWRKRLRDA